MLKSFKYRLYPTPEQQEQIDRTMDICRYVYNVALEIKKTAWSAAQRMVTRYELQKQLTDAKKEFPWLGAASRNALEDALERVELAYDSFFAGRGYPKFKKKRDRQSFKCRSIPKKVDFEKGFLTISRIPDIPIRISRRFDGDIRFITISRSKTRKYFASILVNTSDSKPPTPEPQNAIGVDMGISSLAVLSNGQKFENPKYLKITLMRLAALQRRASKRKKGSQNRNKAYRRIAILHEKVCNQRNDMLHKMSSQIVRDNQVDTICVENLAVANLNKNRLLSKSITDASWGKLLQMIEYKANWHGKNFIRIDRYFPSSKTCSCCGYKLSVLPLSIREWICTQCQSVHDRDINAAINIRDQGLILSGRGTPVEPVESPAFSGGREAGIGFSRSAKSI